jgi:hypothetical protein
MNASHDFMQMPHEGDESESSSSDMDECCARDRDNSYSEMDSNEFGHKDSSDYSDSYTGADGLDNTSDTPASKRND